MNRLNFPPLATLKTVLLTLLWCPAWTNVAQATHPSASAIVSPLVSEQSPEQSPGSPIAFLKLGEVQYQQGILQSALQSWEQAAQLADAEGNAALLVKSLNLKAIVQQDLGQWTEATESLNEARSRLPEGEMSGLQGQLLNTQGTLQFRQGQIEAALQTWEQSQAIYEVLDDREGLVLSQINQIYALQALGFYHRSGEQLKSLQAEILTLPPNVVQVNTWSSVAQILQALGRYREAGKALDEALTLATELKLTSVISDIWLQRGNLYGIQSNDVENPVDRDNLEKALDAFNQAKHFGVQPATQLQANVNQFRLLLKMKRPTEAMTLWPELIAEIQRLEPSRLGVFARVNVAESLITSAESLSLTVPLPELNFPDRPTLALILSQAVNHAQDLGDPRLESYALGELGHLYEQNQQYSEAFALTEQALLLARSARSEDTIALWEWQKGRILTWQNQIPAAIEAYQNAVNTLQNLRQDLVASTQEVQFSFRESVEPVYRELAALLLQNLDQLSPSDRQSRLIQARATIEALQLAELDNFFRESCLNAQPQSIETIDPHAAVVYPILLKDSIEVILSLPNQPLEHHHISISDNRRDLTFSRLRQSINSAFSANRILPEAKKAYDLIIRPIEETLASHDIETIVFVLDGLLRNIPMALLHDGEQFLIEKYNLALAPGLQLLQTHTTRLNHRQTAPEFGDLTALAAGLSEARNGFEELPNVKTEIGDLATLLEAKPVLLDESFTTKQLGDQLHRLPVSIVHLATHGQFSSEVDETFLLTWDGKISVKAFDQLLKERPIQSPIELLVLSACQTAQGDDRASLGLAGIAVRSGAKSTLGTLWAINDRSTSQLIVHFYRNLIEEKQGKAAALRSAQLEFLHSEEYNHPFYWAPFVLVGQWQ